MKKIIKNSINGIGNILGFDIMLLRKQKAQFCNEVRVNIGAGDWERSGWINLDYPNENYAKVQKKHPFIAYDIRNDKLPFEDSSIGAAYCSHVIEHIEDTYVKTLFEECYRALNSGGGVLRIACPDAEFLYNVSKIGKGFWEWRRPWFEARGLSFDTIHPVECLTREIATPKVRGAGWMECKENYEKEFLTMSMNEFLQFMCKDIPYNSKHTNDHINYWTFDKMAEYLRQAGFKKIIRSKYGASSYYEMQNRAAFDTTHPEMSLYVEAVK